MKTKAAVLREMALKTPYAESRPLAIEEVDLEPPGEGEVLVRVRAAGLCHSDLSTINGSRPRPMPMAIGHEAAGEVVELGPDVRTLEIGDHVVMVFVPSCGDCVPCSEGRPALCEPGAAANAAGSLLSGANRMRANGEPIHHHLGLSAFAEYAVCSERSLVRIDKDLSFPEAALFGCAVLTGVGAAVNTAQVKPGTSVAVLGLGGVGLNALLGARLSGAGQIIGIDLQPAKLDMARQLGADPVFNAADEDCAEQVREATKGGVHTALEMVGSVSALDLAYRITRRGGATVTAGLPHPDHKLELQAVSLVAEERTLMGSYVGGCVPRRDIPRYVALYRQGKLPVDQLLSERIGFDEINLAFDRLDAGETVRQILIT